MLATAFGLIQLSSLQSSLMEHYGILTLINAIDDAEMANVATQDRVALAQSRL